MRREGLSVCILAFVLVLVLRPDSVTASETADEDTHATGPSAGKSEANHAETEAPDVIVLEDSGRNAQESEHDGAENGRDAVYVATLRGSNFGRDASEVVVRINGVHVSNVILLGEDQLSFSVPAELASSDKALKSAFLEVSVGDRSVLKNIPLISLKHALRPVDNRSQKFREDSVDVSDAAGQAKDTVQRDVESGGVEKLHDQGVEDVAHPEHPDVGDEINPHRLRREELRATVDRLLSSALPSDARTVRGFLDEGVSLGDPWSMVTLANALLAGDIPGIARDFDTAVPLVQAAADMGSADGQAVLGFLYATGLAVPALPKDTGRAILMWTFAADGGSVFARTALAHRYHVGLDVPEDCEKAGQYYSQLAKEAVIASQVKVGIASDVGNQDADDGGAHIRPPTPRQVTISDRKRLYEGMEVRPLGEANEVIQYYMHSAHRGDPSAQVSIGNLYYYGAASMPRDPSRARALFERAARAGRADAYAHLGFMDLHAGREDSAISHLTRAAEAGNKLGLHGLAYAKLHGIGMEKNEEDSALLFLKAAELEHPEAMYNLGVMYTDGVGVEKNSKEAFRYFQQAARYGHIQSEYQIGLKLLHGEYPAKRDCNIAVTKYLKDVAQQGPWNRVISRALRSYESGDYGNALYRYLQAAHAGIELGQYNAAFMLEHRQVFNRESVSLARPFTSRVLPVDSAKLPSFGDLSQKADVSGGRVWTRDECVEKAMELYQMSASQGYSQSMVRVGDLVYGERSDYRKAISAYERASRMRNSEAMFSLGWMHARGYGVKPDANLAKRYFDQARDADSDAVLPAVIAVYLLRYQKPLLELVDVWNALFAGGDDDDPAHIRTVDAVHNARVGSGAALEGDEEVGAGRRAGGAAAWIEDKPFDSERWGRYGDIAILTILVGLLGGVVNARHRRILRENEAQENEEDASEDGGDDGVDGDVQAVDAGDAGGNDVVAEQAGDG